MKLQKLLIANRGEVALRIMRSAADAGIDTVSVYATDDAGALHTRRASYSVALSQSGARAYLDKAALIAAALKQRCDAIHPGWGFLSEDASFAEDCDAQGIIFVGPTAAQLAKLGDKLAARRLAKQYGIPVLEASSALASVADIKAFKARLRDDAKIMLKAAAGGGGRGMAVLDESNAEALLDRCRAEAQAAFGNNTLYAERLVRPARHVEVQILGDGNGVAHFGDRDCSLTCF